MCVCVWSFPKFNFLLLEYFLTSFRKGLWCKLFQLIFCWNFWIIYSFWNYSLTSFRTLCWQLHFLNSLKILFNCLPTIILSFKGGCQLFLCTLICYWFALVCGVWFVLVSCSDFKICLQIFWHFFEHGIYFLSEFYLLEYCINDAIWLLRLDD